MKLTLNGDTVGVETSTTDVEVAKALKDTADSAANLLDAAGIGMGTCEWKDCGRRARLRPYQLTVDGEFQVLQLCEKCQTRFVNEAAEQHERRQDGDDAGEALEQHIREGLHEGKTPQDIVGELTPADTDEVPGDDA